MQKFKKFIMLSFVKQHQDDFGSQDFQQPNVDPYAQHVMTPRPQPQKQAPPTLNQQFQLPRPIDPYAQAPGRHSQQKAISSH
jgi:hypothetical protein